MKNFLNYLEKVMYKSFLITTFICIPIMALNVLLIFIFSIFLKRVDVGEIIVNISLGLYISYITIVFLGFFVLMINYTIEYFES